MLSKKMQRELNKQINAELYSMYLYQAMSAHFESNSLDGFAHWMDSQAKEEQMHAIKIYKHVLDRGGKVVLFPIEAPPSEWKSSLDAFEAAYKHELKVTGLINKLVDLSIKESDHATNAFLQWYVDEQVEEEKSADDVVQKLKLIGNDKSGLFMLDRELAARIPLFTIPLVAGEGA